MIIFSLGVIHHIKADDVIKNIYNHLIEKGTFFCSVYAKEKNKVLINLLNILSFTKKLMTNMCLCCHLFSIQC